MARKLAIIMLILMIWLMPFISSQLSGDKVLWSEAEVCKFIKGCNENYGCYPQGYIKDNQYCGVYYIGNSFERVGFVNQLESEETCSYDYQCKSNFCFNGECVGSFQAMMGDVLSRISNLEEKIGFVKESKAEIEEISLVEDTETDKAHSWFLRIFKNLLKRSN
ncbi:MAG: hypothetical protein Q8P57_03005 [Candidatus Pacearchaeota archaeon]|nr:hypothetical protein [Candidatus Pacearchaeota archaeon]